MGAQLVLLVPLGNTGLVPGHDLPGGGWGGRPDQGLPGGGGHPGNRPPGSYPGRPDQGLPGGGGHPSQPIYHPGHPDHELPSQPGHIGNQLPWSPGHPDNSLPVPPGITPPDAPADLASQLIVLWRMPNAVEWHGKAMDPSLSPDQGLPPAPEPKY